MPEYVILQGDNFYQLAQRFGGTCEDWILANPGINPLTLQIGQKVILPELNTPNAREQYAEISAVEGTRYAGEKMDEVEMEIEGVRFRIKRIGESKVPHEVHLIVPRTEIHKIQPQGEQGPCEVQIMISNVDIVHSPRLMSERGGTTGTTGTTGTQGTTGTTGVAGTAAAPSAVTQTPGQSQPQQNPLAQTQELDFDIRQTNPIQFRK